MQGVPFDYKRKGKAIPPPKDRKPLTTDYKIMQAHEPVEEYREAKPKPVKIEKKAEEIVEVFIILFSK